MSPFFLGSACACELVCSDVFYVSMSLCVRDNIQTRILKKSFLGFIKVLEELKISFRGYFFSGEGVESEPSPVVACINNLTTLFGEYITAFRWTQSCQNYYHFEVFIYTQVIF